MKRLTIILALLFAPQASAQDAETRVYGAAQSCVGLRAYLRNYPAGRFVTEARTRLARECPTETTTPVQRPAPQKTAPAPVRAPTGDPCVQARADWANINGTREVSVLQAYLTTVPASCPVQSALAQARIDSIGRQTAADAAARDQAVWNGVPEFEGLWTDPDFPYCRVRFRVENGRIRTGSGPYTVVSRSPPTLREDSSGYTFVLKGSFMENRKRDGTRTQCLYSRATG